MPVGYTQEATDSDGTIDGISGSAQDRFGSTVNQEVSDAAFSVNSYWTGWWPECHIEVHKAINADVFTDVIISVDLIGSFTIEKATLGFYGIETMTEQEAEYTAKEVADATSAAFSAALGILAFTYLLAWQAAATAAATITFATEGIFWALLGIALGVTGLYYATMLWNLMETGSPHWISALAFLGLAIKSLCGAAGQRSAAGRISAEYKFIGKIGDLFFDNVLKGPLGDIFEASRHRSHWALMVAQIIVFIVAISISALLWIGAFNGM